MKTDLKPLIFSVLLLFQGVHQVFADSSVSDASPSIYDHSWKWVNEDGKEISFSEYKGSPLVITMTYTSCKMSCPTTIRTLKSVSRDLEKKAIHAHFIIVSFDPRMDTPHKLTVYKKSWNLPEATWHFLSSDEKTLKGLEDFLNFKVTYLDDHFIHDKKIMIIGLDGKIKESFESWNSNITDALTH